MNTFKSKMKKKSLDKSMQIKGAINTFIQPFKELPSINNTGKENADRINEHDLFSLYTADIIKEDIVYAR